MSDYQIRLLKAFFLLLFLLLVIGIEYYSQLHG